MDQRMSLHNAAIQKHAFFSSIIALCCTLVMVIVMMPLAAQAHASEGTMIPGRHRSSYRLLQLADYVLQTTNDDKKLCKTIHNADLDHDDTHGKPTGKQTLSTPERSLVAKEFSPSYQKRRSGSSE